MTDKLDEFLRRGRELDRDATSGPWENYECVMEPLAGKEPRAINLIRTAWINGQAKAKVGIPYQWVSAVTKIREFHDYRPEDAALIAHMRNHYRALLDVVEAAKRALPYVERAPYSGSLPAYEALDAALDRLTKETDR